MNGGGETPSDFPKFPAWLWDTGFLLGLQHFERVLKKPGKGPVDKSWADFSIRGQEKAAAMRSFSLFSWFGGHVLEINYRATTQIRILAGEKSSWSLHKQEEKSWTALLFSSSLTDTFSFCAWPTVLGSYRLVHTLE